MAVAEVTARVTVGAVLSMVMESALEAGDAFPAPSDCEAVTLHAPFANPLS